MLRWVVGIDRLGGGSPPQEGCRPPSGRPQSVQIAPELRDGQRVAMVAGPQILAISCARVAVCIRGLSWPLGIR